MTLTERNKLTINNEDVCSKRTRVNVKESFAFSTSELFYVLVMAVLKPHSNIKLQRCSCVAQNTLHRMFAL